MMIYGVALLAVSMLLGIFVGELLGLLIGVDANVGGVGIAMVFLIAGRLMLERAGLMDDKTQFGVLFWAGIYIPIVVAMAATQNVVAAVTGGPLVIVTALVSITVSFATVALLARVAPEPEGAMVRHDDAVDPLDAPDGRRDAR